MSIAKAAIEDYLSRLAAGIPHLQVTNLQKEFIKAGLRALIKMTPAIVEVPPAPAAEYVQRADCAEPFKVTVGGDGLMSGEACHCHAQMGNDFWFLPADCCLYRKEKPENIWLAGGEAAHQARGQD